MVAENHPNSEDYMIFRYYTEAVGSILESANSQVAFFTRSFTRRFYRKHRCYLQGLRTDKNGFQSVVFTSWQYVDELPLVKTVTKIHTLNKYLSGNRCDFNRGRHFN